MRVFLELAGGLPYPFMKIRPSLWAVSTARNALTTSSSSLLGKKSRKHSVLLELRGSSLASLKKRGLEDYQVK